LSNLPPPSTVSDPNAPPLYSETIILYADTVGTWLWLENYEDALLSDGTPGKKIHLKVGIGRGGQKRIFNAGPDGFGRQANVQLPWSISRYLDVLEIIKFQQQVLIFAQQPTTITSTSEFISTCIIEGLKIIPISVIEPARKISPYDIGKQYILPHPSTRQRDSWKRHFVTKEESEQARKENKLPKLWEYQKKVPSHLQPSEYDRYEEKGFVGYFPRPDYVLQEEQTELSKDTENLNSKLGTTKSYDVRDIQPILYQPIVKVLPNVKPTPESDPFEQILKATDEFLKAMYAREEQEAINSGKTIPPKVKQPIIGSQRTKESDLFSPDVKNTKPLHSDMDRISCFAFRGDSRDPVDILQTGFLPNLARKDPNYKPPLPGERKDRIQAMLDTVQNDMNPKSWIQAMVEARVFVIGDFVEYEAYGAFISTSKSLAIAKCFTSFYHFQFQTDKTLDIYNTEAFCYIVHLSNALYLAPHGALQRAINKFHNIKEQEISNIGPITPQKIYGFRLCCALPIGQRLVGPVWLRKDLKLKSAEFSSLYDVFSGKSQGGPVSYIYRSYAFAIVTNKPDLPAKKDI